LSADRRKLSDSPPRTVIGSGEFLARKRRVV
jgi:hypothetical protein